MDMISKVDKAPGIYEIDKMDNLDETDTMS